MSEYKRFCKALKLEDDSQLIEEYKKVHSPEEGWPEITQGMREVGITESSNGLEVTFDTIFELATQCRFSNCTHIHEKGCAIIEAIEFGEIDEDSYDSYIRLEREKQFFESSAQDKKKKDKNLGKLIKSAKNVKRHNKY